MFLGLEPQVDPHRGWIGTNLNKPQKSSPTEREMPFYTFTCSEKEHEWTEFLWISELKDYKEPCPFCGDRKIHQKLGP
ncbi:MAG: hypothetical protein ACRDF4_04990, partial [Rhabdochlamydiaceae bacterium]